jgi:hypothetical protein
MRMVAHGKVYDTETARRVAEREAQIGTDGEVREVLYRKKTGEYFLHGRGGKETHYARRTRGGGLEPAEAIVPLDYAVARAWGESHLAPEAFAAHFGTGAEAEGWVTLTLRVSKTAHSKLKREQSRTGRKMGELLSEIVEGSL